MNSILQGKQIYQSKMIHTHRLCIVVNLRTKNYKLIKEQLRTINCLLSKFAIHL